MRRFVFSVSKNRTLLSSVWPLCDNSVLSCSTTDWHHYYRTVAMQTMLDRKINRSLPAARSPAAIHKYVVRTGTRGNGGFPRYFQKGVAFSHYISPRLHSLFYDSTFLVFTILYRFPRVCFLHPFKGEFHWCVFFGPNMSHCSLLVPFLWCYSVRSFRYE